MQEEKTHSGFVFTTFSSKETENLLLNFCKVPLIIRFVRRESYIGTKKNNLAFMATLISIYPLAVCSMKKYLMLVPDADDAHEAQDKKYEWEVFLK